MSFSLTVSRMEIYQCCHLKETPGEATCANLLSARLCFSNTILPLYVTCIVKKNMTFELTETYLAYFLGWACAVTLKKVRVIYFNAVLPSMSGNAIKLSINQTFSSFLASLGSNLPKCISYPINHSLLGKKKLHIPNKLLHWAFFLSKMGWFSSSD